MVHFTLFLSNFFAFVKEKKDRFLIISFLILFVFSALRYEYGNDYIQYSNYFNQIKNNQNPFGIEYLFFILNKLSYSFQVVIIISSAFFLFTVYWLITSNGDRNLYGLAVFIFLINPYLFLMDLSTIRQSISISIFIIATSYAYKKKLLAYLVCMLLSFLCHKSSIILLPFYLIANNKKLPNIFYILSVMLILFIFIFSNTINEIIKFIVYKFNNKNYEYYFNNLQKNSLRATLLSSIFLIYVIINMPKVEGKDLMYSKLYLCGLFCALFAYVVPMMTRIQMYFDIYSILVLPKIFYINLKKSRGISLIVNVIIFPILIVFIYFLRYYSFFTNEMWASFREYHVFLFK